MKIAAAVLVGALLGFTIAAFTMRPRECYFTTADVAVLFDQYERGLALRPLPCRDRQGRVR